MTRRFSGIRRSCLLPEAAVAVALRNAVTSMAARAVPVALPSRRRDACAAWKQRRTGPRWGIFGVDFDARCTDHWNHGINALAGTANDDPGLRGLANDSIRVELRRLCLFDLHLCPGPHFVGAASSDLIAGI